MKSNGGLQLLIACHADDIKGAGTDEARKELLDALTAEFGKLKTSMKQFDCVGVTHVQSEDCPEIFTHQQGYVKQLKEINEATFAMKADTEIVSEYDHWLYRSLVGAVAWLTLTMPAICVFVAYLQRQCSTPTCGDVRKANRLLRWIQKRATTLGIRYKKLIGPQTLYVLSDSAFGAEEHAGLVMRGCVVARVAEAGPVKTGKTYQLRMLDWYSRKHTRCTFDVRSRVA